MVILNTFAGLHPILRDDNFRGRFTLAFLVLKVFIGLFFFQYHTVGLSPPNVIDLFFVFFFNERLFLT